jgi:hypothetical protein
VRTAQRADVQGLVARIEDEDALHRARSVAPVSALSSSVETSSRRRRDTRSSSPRGARGRRRSRSGLRTTAQLHEPGTGYLRAWVSPHRSGDRAFARASLVAVGAELSAALGPAALHLCGDRGAEGARDPRSALDLVGRTTAQAQARLHIVLQFRIL